MDVCVFCAIVAERAEASVVAADERAVAFLDILPVTTGHTLVVPRAHAAGLVDLPVPDGAAMMTMARRVAGGLRASELADGINLFLADGEVAGQEVFHVHLHVIPRWASDGVRVQVDYDPTPSRAQLDEVAARLRSALRT